ncbi:MAG: hypothetical protein IJB64_03585 [Akkermansia sp.]|nr:hypothetical protein [Akkermansia sp.]
MDELPGLIEKEMRVEMIRCASLFCVPWLLQREQVMALWNDVAWCARPDNDSPIAAMSDCMWNLKYIRDSLRGSASYIRAQNGGKTAFICADASQAVWDKAEKFLE